MNHITAASTEKREQMCFIPLFVGALLRGQILPKAISNCAIDSQVFHPKSLCEILLCPRHWMNKDEKK